MSEEQNGVSRRSLIKGAALGGIGIAGGATLLSSCGKASGPMSFGARTVDESPTKQLKGLVAAYTKKTGNKVTYNATESNAFQNNLSQYLQGTPDDAFQWMAGYRMQFFAEQGLLEDLSDVWKDLDSQYANSYKIASTGLDGKQYFVPQSWYPWGLHSRR
ncbi:MAG: extracellular solute-binding protein [Candidatus Planktophila sp.]